MLLVWQEMGLLLGLKVEYMAGCRGVKAQRVMSLGSATVVGQRLTNRVRKRNGIYNPRKELAFFPHKLRLPGMPLYNILSFIQYLTRS